MDSQAPLSERKRELRGALLFQRRKLLPADLATGSAAVCVGLEKWMASRQPTITQVFAFWPLAGEPDLRALFKSWIAAGVKVGLPVTRREELSMTFRAFDPDRPLVIGAMGIAEPDVSHGPVLSHETSETVILVPALALDRHGRRLGLGKGFYDRFLQGKVGISAVGVVFSIFILEDVPAEPHDVQVGFLATELGVTDAIILF